MSKVHFLGTNGWYSSPTGYTTCHLIDAPEAYIILDAGTGLFKVDKYIVEDKPVYLFLSHVHFDHIFGVHILNKFKFTQGLKIFVAQQNYNSFMEIFKQPYTIAPKDLPFSTDVIQFEPGLIEGLSFKVYSKRLVHISPCYGYRFELSDATISFCTDTGKCPALIELARNADLLITECALKPGEENKKWPHLNPTDSAESAIEASCKKLAVIHYDSEKYQSIKEREIAFKHTLRVFPNSIMAKDDLTIEVLKN